MVSTEIFIIKLCRCTISGRILTVLNNIGLNKHKEIYMLNFIKKLFGTKKPAEVAVEVKAVEAKTTLEFHEEIKQQVEAEKKTFPVKEAKPAVKAKSVKAKKPAVSKAPAKATAKKAPAKKSKKQ
jgi:predicted RND superfamily exporter protein